MKTWVKLALRELINHRGFSLFFLANLTLGLVGFIALDSFKLSLHEHIEKKSKAILAADLAVYASRPFTEEEEAVLAQNLPPGTQVTRQINFMSMIQGPKETRLVEIVAVDSGYPLYGELTLKSGLVGPKEVRERLLGGNRAWVQPELVQLLGVEPQGQIRIGDQDFNVDDQLLEAPGQNFWNAGIAYKVFIGYDQALKTGLIRQGSRRYHYRLYQLPAGVEANPTARALFGALKAKFGPSPYLYLRTYSQANQQMSRVLSYLNDYLGLVALVALFLAGMGTAFLFRSFLSQRLKDLAILRALGAKPWETVWLSVFQIAILGAVAALLSSLLAQLALPLLVRLLSTFLPLGFVTLLSYKSMALAFGVGILGSTLFCLPLLLGLLNLSPKLLLQEAPASLAQEAGLSTWASALAYLPLGGLYWALAVWQSKSLFVGSLFLGGLVLSALVLSLLGLLPLWFGVRGLTGLSLSLRLALRNLGRGGGASVTSVIALGLGALLINLIPQIHEGLATEIASPDSTKLPSFFLFDIQPDQVAPLESYIASLGYQAQNRSAMVLARLTHINGRSMDLEPEQASQTREEENEEFTRRRDQNLSYRSELYDSEELVEGAWFSGPYDPAGTALPEISLEVRFAERLGVGIGDRLSFDVQGVPLEGRITSLRRVRWNSFTPNFFVLFQPGVLEDAPSTWLATVFHVPEGQKTGFQNQVNRHFTNVSLINVTGLVGKVLEIAGQVRWAIQVMAFLAVLAGLVVVYSIASFNAKARETEINLLKILGASFGNLQWMVALEFGLVGFFASLAGAALSLGIAWGLAQFLFERIFVVNLGITLITVAGVTLLSLLAGWLATRRTLAKSPAQLLNAL